MYTVSDLIKAVRNGNTEEVESIADELDSQDIDISSALKIARSMNKLGKTRGKWSDIVELLESYFEDDD
jgi:hypothetical protein